MILQYNKFSISLSIDFSLCRDAAKGPAAANASNAALVAAFHEYATLLKAKKDFFKYKAIFGVATALSDLDYTVTSGKQVKDIKGIGKSSQLKIDEFVSTGKIGAIDDLKGESGVAAAPISKDAEIALKFV